MQINFLSPKLKTKFKLITYDKRHVLFFRLNLLTRSVLLIKKKYNNCTTLWCSRRRIICSSRFLYRLSCRTFLIATRSLLPISLAWYTTPNDPLPITLASVYEISSVSSSPLPLVAITVVSFEGSLPLSFISNFLISFSQ